MKILAIRVKNLASLEGVTDIDFADGPLHSAGIFAITGPTGAGKSTILDALCLALYAKTPRYIQAKESGIDIQDITGSKISQGDIRGILRDGTADGYAEVDFVGSDGVKYRAKWQVRRSRNKIDGALQTDSVELTNLTTNLPIPGRKTETLKEIERLVGLNFEQFTRSVLLAQGDFTAFLKASKDDKSSLLEKLTGTDIYSEISKRIYERYKEAEGRLKELNDLIGNIIILDDEQLSAIQKQKEEIGLIIKPLKSQLDNLSGEINWYHTFIDLNEQFDKAKSAKELAENKKTEAEGRILFYSLVNSAQTARSLVDAKDRNQELFNQKEKANHKLESDIQLLKENHDAALIQLDSSDKAVARAKDLSQAARPDIAKANKLDAMITEKTKQLSDADDEARKATQKRDEQFILVNGSKASVTEIIKQIEALTKWKTDNVARQPVAENIIEIGLNLAEASKVLVKQKNWAEEVESANLSIGETNKQFNKFSETVSSQAATLAEMDGAYKAKSDQLALVSIQNLNTEAQWLNTALTAIRAAHANWNMLQAARTAFNAINSKILACISEISAKTEEKSQKETLLQVALAKKQQTEKLFSQAKLQVAENVENLRQQLADDDECPVCGSRHHPFVAGNTAFHKMFDGIEKEHKNCNNIYDKLLIDTAGLDSLLEKLGRDNIGFEKELEEKSAETSALNAEWLLSKIDQAGFELPAQDVHNWLEAQMISMGLAQEKNKKDLNDFNEAKSELEKQKTAKEALKEELNANEQKVKDIEREKLSQMKESIRLAELGGNYNTSLAGYTDPLSIYFDKPSWMDAWKQDPFGFEESIREFALNWKNKTSIEGNLNKNLGILETTLAGQQAQWEAYNAESISKDAKVKEHQGILSGYEEQRAGVFNGEQVILIEERFKKAIDDAEIAQKRSKAEEEKLNRELSKARTEKVANDKDIDGFKDALEKCNHTIISWIEDYNLAHEGSMNEIMLINLLSHSQNWMEAEGQFKSEIEEVLFNAKNIYDERIKQTLRHQEKKISERPIEELERLQKAATDELDQKNEESHKIDFKLSQDAENKKKAGKIFDDISTQAAIHDNWSKLNDLIGSADGKKFRQIAQEYTLDILLGFANTHLKDLSHRYRLLRVPGSLGLQVLDQDMGDELRTVYSLSGGESFLVSLALALGLASLSSNKMKVESLFIDEGFGSLDPETLNIAMDALERLHNQGRKVGVISHVQEMTERIPTQIKVSKLSNGKSRVEVVTV